MFPQQLDSPLAYDIAKAMMDGFNRHYRLFRTESARAKHRFETADWHGQQRGQRERIEFYDLRVREASVRLARVGFHNLLGHLEGGLRAWQYANLPTERIDSIDGLDVAYFQQTGEAVLVDVRKDSEVRGNGLKRSFHIPLADLPHRLIDFDPVKTYLLCCVGGYRSMIAASLLRRSGVIHVMDVRGGVNQLKDDYPEALASNF